MATKETFFEGKTIDAAVERAAAELGQDKDLLSYELVQQATRGIFGIGATPARIKVLIEVPDAPKPEKKADKKPRQPKQNKEVTLPDGFVPEKISKKQPGGNKQSAPKQEIPPVVIERKLTPVAEGDEVVPAINDFLLGLLEKLGIENGKVIVSRDEENDCYFAQVDGSKMGVLIGRRGETLDAAQYLANLVINRGRDKKVRVVLDSENYRSKRIATLQSLAIKTAEKAVKYRKNQALEPMDSYERRIIHATLSGREHISTYSVGTDPRRKVIVAYEK